MQTRSRRQREILDYLIEFVDSHGFEPSYQQIARHCGLSSKGGVARHIEALEKQGLVKRHHDNGSFRLEVIPESIMREHISEVEWLEVPEADDGSGPLYIPRSLLGYLSPSKVRGMIVPDNAMADEHILEGDIAIIECRSFARDGDCIAAIVKNNGLKLGNYFRKGSSVELRPSNTSYDAIRVRADKLEVLGLFRGLLRKV